MNEGAGDLSEVIWVVVQVVYVTVAAAGMAATRSRILSAMRAAPIPVSSEELLVQVSSAYHRLWRVLSIILAMGGVGIIALGSGSGWFLMALAVLAFVLARPLGELFADWELRHPTRDE